MRFDDKIWVEVYTETEDLNMNKVESKSWEFMGKCKILPTSNASKTYDEDGKSYIYSKTLFVKNPNLIPAEGNFVKLYSNTSKTESTGRVSGVCVLPRKYVKLIVT